MPPSSLRTDRPNVRPNGALLKVPPKAEYPGGSGNITAVPALCGRDSF